MEEAAVNDLAHLVDKQVLARLVGAPTIYPGVVTNVEPRGVWIEAPSMINALAQDAAWASLMASINEPIIFVPFSGLAFLIGVKV